ncbi:MAG: PP2C family protein-serine/threonine phosphatase [Candidatus Bruticola sp.]
MGRLLNWFSKMVESVTLHCLSPAHHRLLVFLIVLLLIASTAAIAFDIGGLPYNWFAIPVFLSCIFFRRGGAKVLIPAFLLLMVGLWCRQKMDLVDIISWSSFELAKWSIVAAFTILTVEGAVRRHRRDIDLEHDVDRARTLQRALVPPDCEIGRVKLCGSMQPCRSVGGDFYYFRPFQEKYIVFCLGDVMGKGIPASMIMSIVMSFFFEWGKKSPSPSHILEILNGRLLGLWRDDNTWFTTLFYGVFNEENSLLTYASGGHDTALLLKNSGVVERLHTDGMPIGAFEESVWDEKSVRLEDGDRVVLFTDGLTEERSAQGEFFGFDRVVKFLEEHHSWETEKLIKALETAALNYAGGVADDDMAILVMEVKKGVKWNPQKGLVAKSSSSAK